MSNLDIWAFFGMTKYYLWKMFLKHFLYLSLNLVQATGKSTITENHGVNNLTVF